MMVWNVTYNDPGRWREVYVVAGPKWGWMEGLIATVKGCPIGSPKLHLESVDGLLELEHGGANQQQLTPINFQRTRAGAVAYSKVRLEVYGIPFRWDEVQSTERRTPMSGSPRMDLVFKREDRMVTLTLSGSQRAIARMEAWLAMAMAHSS